jgi:Spy/CpxP family protein refolding chaperone
MTFRTVLIAVALALTTLTPVAKAQGPSPAMQAEMAAFQKSLNITPQQKAKLEAIGKKYQPKMMAIQKKYTPQLQKVQQANDAKGGAALMKKINAEVAPIMAAQRKEADPIFTPEQRAKIKAFEAKMKKMGMGG